MKVRQRIILSLSVIVLLMIGMPSIAVAEGFGGTYNITAVADQSGKTYTTDIGIEDLGNGEIEVSAVYEGVPFSIVGKSDSAGPDGGTYDFDIDIPSLFDGEASINIKKTSSGYEVSGAGGGDYTWFGSSGSGSGKASGARTSEELPASTGIPALNTLGESLGFLAAEDNFAAPNIFALLGGAGLALLGILGSRFAAGLGGAPSPRPPTTEIPKVEESFDKPEEEYSQEEGGEE